MSAAAVLRFTVDKEMQKAKAKKRKLQRQRMGFVPKKRKLMQPEKLAVELDSEESWLRYLRFMFIAGYKMIQSEILKSDDVLDVIEGWCPAEVSDEPPVYERDEGRELLEEHHLGPICDMLTSYKEKTQMEPSVVVKASKMLERLSGYFPVSRESLKDTPYDNECKLNIVGEEDISRLANSFKQAAKHGLVGAELTTT